MAPDVRHMSDPAAVELKRLQLQSRSQHSHYKKALCKNVKPCHDVFHVGRGVVVLMRNWDAPGSTVFKIWFELWPGQHARVHTLALLYLHRDSFGSVQEMDCQKAGL